MAYACKLFHCFHRRSGCTGPSQQGTVLTTCVIAVAYVLQVKKIFFPTPEALLKAAESMVVTALELIKERSFTIVGKDTLSVEIVRDVFNVLPLHWVAKVVRLAISA